VEFYCVLPLVTSFYYSQLAMSYACATGGAVGTALTINRFVKVSKNVSRDEVEMVQ